MTDECTTKKLQVSYAHVIIEVDLTTNLKIKITIRDPNGAQSYTRSRLRMKTTFYNLCNTVRHECKKKEQHQKEKPIQKQVWEPKKDTHQVCNENENTKEREDQIVGDDKGKGKENEEDLATWIVVKSTFKGNELRYKEKREQL